MNIVKNIAFFGMLLAAVQAFGAEGRSTTPEHQVLTREEVERRGATAPDRRRGEGGHKVSRVVGEYLAARGAFDRLRYEDNVSPEQLAAAQERVRVASEAKLAEEAAEAMNRVNLNQRPEED